MLNLNSLLYTFKKRKPGNNKYIVRCSNYNEVDKLYNQCINGILCLENPTYTSSIKERSIEINGNDITFVDMSLLDKIQPGEYTIIDQSDFYDRFFEIVNVHDFLVVCDAVKLNNINIHRKSIDILISDKTNNKIDVKISANVRTVYNGCDRYRFITKGMLEDAVRGFRGKIFSGSELVNLMDRYSKWKNSTDN